MKKITYIFGDGRINKLSKENEYAKDFFYGYHILNQNNNYKTQIVELYSDTENKNKESKILFLLDKFLNKLTFLQFHFHQIFKKNNYKEIINSDVLIFSTDRLGISFFPILIFKKNLKSIVITMGLLKEHKNLKSYQKILRPYVLKMFIKSVDKLIFLGMPEYKSAKEKYPKYSDKFEFTPFAIDFQFWSDEGSNKNEFLESNQILFVGNDGNRNYEFVKKLPEHLSEFNFKFITEQILSNEILNNTELINGNWSNAVVNDIKMRNYYKESFLTILPIKNTIQPSGQSVTLQSLAVGTPILISNFDGFWDPSRFSNNENIFFIDSFDIDTWIKKIEEIFYDQIRLKKISKNGKNLVMKYYNLEKFTEKLNKLIKEIS